MASNLPLLLSFLGTLIMAFNILAGISFLPVVKRSKYVAWWRFLFYLVILFFVGYVVFFIEVLGAVFSFGREALYLVIGFVYLFGAVFVLLSIKLSHFTFDELLLEIERRKAAEARVGVLMAKANNLVRAKQKARVKRRKGGKK